MDNFNKRKIKFWIITIATSIIALFIWLYIFLSKDKNIVYNIIVSYLAGYGVGVYCSKLLLWLYKRFDVVDKDYRYEIK